MKNSFKLIYKLMFVLAFAFALSACGSKKDSKKPNLNTARRTTVADNNNNPRPNNVDPTYQNSPYGKMYNGSDMTSSVASFLGAADLSQLGTVSGQQNSYDGTGVVFQGSISASCQSRSGSGQIRIYIWDSLAANNQAGAIIVDMPLKNLTQQCALYFEDAAGGLILDGYDMNGIFKGEAYYTGLGGSNPRYLGNFEIATQAFIR